MILQPTVPLSSFSSSLLPSISIPSSSFQFLFSLHLPNPRPRADEGAEAAAEDDKEPGVGLPVEEEEEGVPAEPGGSAEGGPAGERASPQGEPGIEGETGGERGEDVTPLHHRSPRFYPPKVWSSARSGCKITTYRNRQHVNVSVI